MMKVSWEAIKKLIDLKHVYPQYTEDDDTIYIVYVDGAVVLHTTIDKRLELEKAEDFNINYKDFCNAPVSGGDVKSTIKVSWERFKHLVDIVGAPHYSTDSNDNHIVLFCTLNGLMLETTLLKLSDSYQEYVDNYSADTNTNGGYDHAGRQIIRTASTYKGWSYLANGFDYTTSSGVLAVKDAFGDDKSSEFTVKRYDENGDVTTTPSECVREEIVWKPNYDFDLVAGNFYQAERATQDLRVWVYGGAHELSSIANVEFARNLNAKLILEARTDGRSSKHVKKDTENVPYQTNQITFVFEHAAGFSHDISFVLEFYRL
jgi:hypothetical protein